MAKVPEGCPKEIAPFIKDGIELCDVTFHNALSPFGGEPEHRFHSQSQKPSRKVNAWLTRAGYFLEKNGKWRHVPEAHGKISEPSLEKMTEKNG